MPLVIILIAAAIILLLGGAMSRTPNCPQPPAPSQEIFDLASAIAVAEGSDPDWNNPGDLTYAFGYPTLGTANSAGVLKFQNCADGWYALYHQLGLIVSGGSMYTLDTTLADFGMKYSGGDPNWATNVAKALGGGITPGNSLGDILT
jgi:hypothetical protein